MANNKYLNPYIFGPPVKDPNFFFGREHELEEIVNTIENLPPGLRQSMAIVGPRRIGKSSILIQLKQRLRNIQSPVALISTESIAKASSLLLTQEILFALRDSIQSKCLKDLNVEFDLLDKREPKDERVYQVFRRDLQKLNEQLEIESRRPAVLMIDEVEGLQRFGGKEVLSFFRDLCQSLSYILFVVAGSDQLYQLVSDYTSPFFNVFKPITIHPLEERDARDLIERPAQREGFDFSNDAISKVLELSGGEPYFINMICHYATESAFQNELSSVTLDDVQTAKLKISSEDYFNSAWKQNEDVEKVILYLLASVTKPRSREEIIFDFIDLVDVRLPVSKISFLLHELVQKQILRLDKKRRYFYSNQIFPAWINGRKSILEDIEKIISANLLDKVSDSSSSKRSALETMLNQDNESLSLVEEISRSAKVNEQVDNYLTKLRSRIEITKLELQNIEKTPTQSGESSTSKTEDSKNISKVSLDKFINTSSMFSSAFSLVPKVARSVRRSLRKSSSKPPQIVSVEFGISIEGEAGIPYLTKTKSASNLKIKLIWNDADRRSR